MKDYERIDYLIKTLEGNNARRFADKAGIRTDNLSRARNGKALAHLLYTRILNAYPQVRREWLMDGTGMPFVFDEEKGELLRRMESLEGEVRRLAELIERLAPRG